jgi:Protein tyrosine phosphatase-like protein, PTPLA
VCRYAADALGAKSSFLVWLRYTAFIPIYPLGLAAELINIYRAMPLAAHSRRLSLDMPNAVNMAFSYSAFLCALLAVQPLAWLGIYRTLLRQRQMKLALPPRPSLRKRLSWPRSFDKWRERQRLQAQKPAGHTAEATIAASWNDLAQDGGSSATTLRPGKVVGTS